MISVIQDIYHAEQRVLKMMPKYNYNYFSASMELKKIFSHLKEKDYYTSVVEFTSALDAWQKRWTTIPNATDLTMEELIVWYGHASVGVRIPQKLQKTIKDSKCSVINDKVISALENIKYHTVSSSLMKIQNFQDWVQQNLEVVRL